MPGTSRWTGLPNGSKRSGVVGKTEVSGQSRCVALSEKAINFPFAQQNSKALQGLPLPGNHTLTLESIKMKNGSPSIQLEIQAIACIGKRLQL